MQAGKIVDVLMLLMLANRAPLVAKELLGGRRSDPLDGREGHAFRRDSC
jgi:hypothetical protein